MKVPFTLRRRPAAGPAVAALYPVRDAAPPLDLCAALGLDPAGRVFEAGAGLLLHLDRPTDRPVPGALRLRAIAPDLLLPADAELVPALLDDEAAGLVRDRGLIFLPDGRALAYDPGAPVPPAALLAARPGPRRAWAPLPDRPPLADRIESILVDRPEETPGSVLDAGGGADVGSRPIDAGAAASGAGGAKGAAGAAAPSPSVLRRQADALAKLLREFREGNVERALRKAPPLAGVGDSRGAGAFTGDRLPERDLRYRLEDLVGAPPAGSGGGGAPWRGGVDRLAGRGKEYRKAAEAALRRGDHRRAAAIYAKLLRDDRAAVAALLQGGLYHDAGVLLLARLDDRRGAARAFESAGEFDRALGLYRGLADHEAAGDLLRRLGEEEAAVAEYVAAADRLAAPEGGHLAAGDLLRDKAGRPDLALAHYAAGWARRPAANAVPCALRVARHRAEAGDAAALRALLDQADAHFNGPGDPREPGGFYNAIAALADGPRLASARDDLRDRALLGLAAQLRRHARRGERTAGLAAALFGAAPHWDAPLVSDAAHAIAAAGRPRPGATPAPGGRFRLGTGLVSAVAGAGASGDVFVGFERGDVVAFRPETSELVAVASYDLPVAALATDPRGEHLVVLRAHPAGRGIVSTYGRQPDGRFALLAGTTLDEVRTPWLTPVLTGPLEQLVGLWDGETFHVLAVGSLASWGGFPLPGPDAGRPPGLLLPADRGDEGEFAILTHDGRQWCLVDPWGDVIHQTGLSWRPAPPPAPLRSLPLSWAEIAPDVLDLAGLDAPGILHWGRLASDEAIARNSKSAEDAADPYRAVAVVRDGLLAAVRDGGVDWLRTSAIAFGAWRATAERLDGAQAAFVSRPTRELIVVCEDGGAVRLPVPS